MTTFALSATMGSVRVALQVLDPRAAPDPTITFVVAPIGTPMPRNTWNLADYLGGQVSAIISSGELLNADSLTVAHLAWESPSWRLQQWEGTPFLTALVVNGASDPRTTVILSLDRSHRISLRNLQGQSHECFFTLTPVTPVPARREAKHARCNRRSCFVDMLPREMIKEILKHVDADDSYTLMQCEYVCKEWTELARACRTRLVIRTRSVAPYFLLASYPNVRNIVTLMTDAFGPLVVVQNNNRQRIDALNMVGHAMQLSDDSAVRKVVLRRVQNSLEQAIPLSTEHLVLGAATDFLLCDSTVWPKVTRLDVFAVLDYSPGTSLLVNALITRSHFPSVTTFTWNNLRSTGVSDGFWLSQYPNLKRLSLNHCVDFLLIYGAALCLPRLERLYVHYTRKSWLGNMPEHPAFRSLRYLYVCPTNFRALVACGIPALPYLEELHVGYSGQGTGPFIVLHDFWSNLTDLTAGLSLRRFVCFNLWSRDIDPPETMVEGSVSRRTSPLEIDLLFQDTFNSDPDSLFTLYLRAILAPSTRVVVGKQTFGDPYLTADDRDMVLPQFLARREF